MMFDLENSIRQAIADRRAIDRQAGGEGRMIQYVCAAASMATARRCMAEGDLPAARAFLADAEARLWDLDLRNTDC